MIFMSALGPCGDDEKFPDFFQGSYRYRSKGVPFTMTGNIYRSRAPDCPDECQLAMSNTFSPSCQDNSFLLDAGLAKSQ
jgi:hypothetical protein